MKYIAIKAEIVYKSKFRGPTYVDRNRGKNADITDAMLSFFNKLFKGEYRIVFI